MKIQFIKKLLLVLLLVSTSVLLFSAFKSDDKLNLEIQQSPRLAQNLKITAYQLNMQRELNTLQNKQLAELKQRDHDKRLYLAGNALIILLALMLIILISHTLRKTQRNHHNAKLQNQYMQITLSELERVNDNYIRIMRVMAHDLRNPLSGMTGLAAMLLGDGDFSDESKHMLRLIETTGMHSMEMINELLKTGLANDNEVVQMQQLDLKSLLYDSVELLQFKASEKNQQLVFESSDMPVIANVNYEKIWRVFNNLIINAIKFSYEGGVIRAGAWLDKDSVMISVSDNGIGIPDADKENIFEMFTQAKKQGTNGEQPFGLGLSISKKIIEMHHGKIWFESTQGEGTTFYISLPSAEYVMQPVNRHVINGNLAMSN